MAHGPVTPKSPSLRGHAATCLLLSGLGVAITLLFHSGPAFQQWSTQCRASGSGRCGRGTWVRRCIHCSSPPVRCSASHTSIGPRGNRSFWDKSLLIGSAAGVGEELLFRAALLPLLGLWVSSGLFAIAHLRTAQIAATRVQRVAYIANTFVAGAVLGLVFIHVGLLAAIGIHAIIDVIGLSAMQRLKRLRGAAAAT